MKTSLPDIVRMLLVAFNALLIVYAATRLSELSGESKKEKPRKKVQSSQPKKQKDTKPVETSSAKQTESVTDDEELPLDSKFKLRVNNKHLEPAPGAASIKATPKKRTAIAKPKAHSAKNSTNEPLTFAASSPKRTKGVSENDLTSIEGIGPKSEQILKKSGVKSYHDLAELSPDDIKELLVKSDKRYGMYDVGSWPRQAKLAAAGEWDSLDSLKAKMKSGRL